MKGWELIIIKKNKKMIILTILALVVLIPIIYYMFKYRNVFEDMEGIKNFVLSFGHFSIVIFILIQILQIVVVFIPGEIVQIAGGYIFGPYISFILCILGVLIGGAMCFLLSKKFGKPLVDKITSKNTSWIVKKIESTRHKKTGRASATRIMFVLYLIPGIPKDILGYISGISDMSLKEFLLISTIGRTPALFFTCFFGDQLTTKNTKLIIIFIVVFAVIFALIFIFSRKHIARIKREVEDN